MNHRLILPLALASLLAPLLAACGGGGGGGSSPATNAAPVTTASTETPAPVSEAPTPMATLVVPTTMTWATVSTPALTVTVTDANGVVQPDASVTLSTFTNVSPHDDSPLRKPVALELIDSGVSNASGQAAIAARVPAHLTQLLLVASKGDQSGYTVVSQADLNARLTVRLSP